MSRLNVKSCFSEDFRRLFISGAYPYFDLPSILTAGRRAGFPALIFFRRLFSSGAYSYFEPPSEFLAGLRRQISGAYSFPALC